MPRNLEHLLMQAGPAQSLEPEHAFHRDQTLVPGLRDVPAGSLCDTPPASGSTAHNGRPQPASGLLPQRFGDYEILAPIARGGMGVVYKARQMKLNRTVALKTILAGQLADDLAVRRFYAEAEAAAALDHPNIVPIYEVGEHEGQHFFSMAFVEGGSLETFRADGPASNREAAAIMKGVAEAISYAHERNIIHRDLKPANILLHAVASNAQDPSHKSSNASHDRSAALIPKVTDFGIARRTDADSHLTATGQVLGTPSFMSPEQASGQADRVDKLSDIFSLGAILYFLLTGRPPFDDESLIATLRNILDEDPVPPSRIQPSVDVDLEAICLKCLQKDRSRRYASARELADDLGQFLAGEAVTAGRGQRHRRSRRPGRRKTLTFGLTAAVLAVVLGGTIAAGHLVGIPAKAERDGNSPSTPAGSSSGQADAAGPVIAELQDALQEARQEKERVKEQEEALARERLEIAHRSSYNLHLERAAHLVRTDVAGAAALLHDAQYCPPERREFTWRFLKRLAALDDDSATPASAREASALLETLDVGQVVGVSFAPDGRTLAVGTMSPASTVCIFDLPSGKLRHALPGHTGHVAFLGFAADSRTLFTCDGTALKVWDTASGRLRHEAFEQSTGVTALDSSPDGRELVTLGHDHVLRFWNLQSGRLTSSRRIAADDTGFTVAWTSEGTLLARVDEDVIRVVDAHSGDERFTVPRGAAAVHSLLITGDGRLLVVHEETLLTIWRLNTAEMVADIPPQCVAVSPEGQSLAGVDEDGTLNFWDPWTGQVRASFPGHSAPGYLARFSPDGNYLLTVGLDKTVRIWKAAPHVATQAIPTSLPFHPGG